MALVAEVLREPSYDPKELEQFRTENARGHRAAAQRSGRDCVDRVPSRCLKPYPQGDIRHVDSFDEEGIVNTKAVTREQVLAVFISRAPPRKPAPGLRGG